ATTTVYVHRMNDSYTDSQGDTHYFTVLQYWYFYAMNNWGQTGGFNDHEGDWESVFVFLDNETDQPAYVAFSAHHNDGDDELHNLFQYDSVRRAWGSEEVTFDSGRVVSFTALGSHANYPDNGVDGEHEIPFQTNDFTSNSGNHILGHIKNIEGIIFEYEGIWGTENSSPGGSGPQGPIFIDLTGQNRFIEPIKWAGIDKIERMVLPEPSSQFDVSTVAFDFSEVVPLGTEFYVDEQNEVIVFGVIPQNVEMLPTFWDIESSLENGTFEATVSLPYDPELVQGMGLNEQQLSAMYYNPETVSWEVVPSEVDIENHLILFDTNHFSRYAIGIVEIDSTPTIEELFVELRVSIETADLRDKVKRHLVRRVDRIERIYESDNKRSGKIVERRLNSLVQEVKLLEWLFRVNLSEIDLSINKLKQGLGYD
ncbi:hypothetical protein KC851_00450, partial [Candidatus Kaiserbacteria bacterium]|nr:hypothetical protein [Candidatus Kaiserbacteria bacterium]